MPFFVAGAADGTNPLALSTLVIFILILLFLRRNRQEVLMTGIIFIGTILFTNFLAKNYFFDELFDTDVFYYIAQWTYLFLGLGALAAGAVNLYDWWKIKTTGEIKDSFLKRSPISTVQAKKVSFRWFFVATFSFFTALFLSLIQSVYPSPPYLQALVDVYLIHKLNQELAFYLLIYSFMSVLPLVLALVFVLIGFFSLRFTNFLGFRARTVKIAASAFFGAWGLGLLYQLNKSIFGG